jgi:hypothetical protein
VLKIVAGANLPKSHHAKKLVPLTNQKSLKETLNHLSNHRVLAACPFRQTTNERQAPSLVPSLVPRRAHLLADRQVLVAKLAPPRLRKVPERLPQADHELLLVVEIHAPQLPKKRHDDQPRQAGHAAHPHEGKHVLLLQRKQGNQRPQAALKALPVNVKVVRERLKRQRHASHQQVDRAAHRANVTLAR